MAGSRPPCCRVSCSARRSPSVMAMATQVTSRRLASSSSAVTMPPAPRRCLSSLSWLRYYSTGPRLVATIKRSAWSCGDASVCRLRGMDIVSPFFLLDPCYRVSRLSQRGCSGVHPETISTFPRRPHGLPFWATRARGRRDPPLGRAYCIEWRVGRHQSWGMAASGRQGCSCCQAGSWSAHAAREQRH